MSAGASMRIGRLRSTLGALREGGCIAGRTTTTTTTPYIRVVRIIGGVRGIETGGWGVGDLHCIMCKSVHLWLFLALPPSLQNPLEPCHCDGNTNPHTTSPCIISPTTKSKKCSGANHKTSHHHHHHQDDEEKKESNPLPHGSSTPNSFRIPSFPWENRTRHMSIRSIILRMIDHRPTTTTIMTCRRNLHPCAKRLKYFR